MRAAVFRLQEAEDYFSILSGSYGNMGDIWLERIEANLPCGYQTVSELSLLHYFTDKYKHFSSGTSS